MDVQAPGLLPGAFFIAKNQLYRTEQGAFFIILNQILIAMELAQSVDEYIIKNNHWKEALIILRDIVKSTELKETVKWGAPTYALNGKNVVGLGAFKSYVGLWFFQGSFLKDEHKVLINAQEGKTKGMRQWRFTSIDEMNPELILKYVEEAIQNQKDGKEIKVEKKPLVIPEELEEAFSNDELLSNSFKSLTPGKQKEYANYISEAKRVETRLNRIEKITPMIIEGKGLNDKYK